MFVCSECGAAQPTPGLCPTDNIPLAAIGDDLLLGTAIGAYRIASLLGIGGMGRVYKGVHPSIGSRVAIKVLSRECSDRPDLVERFFSEARAVNVIRHESIVNVLDLSRLPDGRPYIIMEYLDGAPLSSILDEAIRTRTPLPLGGLARLAVEVLDALGAAHGKGVVHRDLKPDNIFVAPSGRPKVLDFGIAKLSDTNLLGSGTRTGSLLGTPHYMSPEQAAGKPVDQRADIYAMGVILYECVTGTKLFQAESLFDLLRKHVEEVPPSPRLIRPDLSPELEAVIATALAKTPEQRFATAQAMSMALQHATSQLPPDQWTPITASGSHRAISNSRPPGAWQPTPPASWGSHAVPRPSELPQQHNSTVSGSSGQVQQQPPPAKKGKGLWIALGAAAAVGAAVTIVLVTRTDDSRVATADPPPPSGDTKPDKPADKPADKTVARDDKPADKPADKVVAKVDDKVAAKPVDKPKAGGDDDDDDLGADLPPDIRAELDKAMAGMSPDMRKELKDLADIAKLPAGERAKKLAELQQRALAAAGQAQDAAGKAQDAAGKARGAVTTMPTGGSTTPTTPTMPTPTTPPPPAAGAWIESHELPAPAGWNPKHVDPARIIAYALAEAKKAVPDAQLTRVEVDGVGPDGFANLTLPTLASSHGSIELRFISPSHMVRDPKVPLGVPVEWKCELRVEAEPDGITIRPINGFDCSKEQPIAVPRCSPGALWKRALGLAKPPPTNAVSSMSFYGWRGAPARWQFQIGFGTDTVYSNTFDDGC